MGFKPRKDVLVSFSMTAMEARAFKNFLSWWRGWYGQLDGCFIHSRPDKTDRLVCSVLDRILSVLP